MNAQSESTRSAQRGNHGGRRDRSRSRHFLADLGMCLANFAFYPLSYFTLFPEVRRDLLGLGEGILIDGPLHVALFVSAWAMMVLARGREHGPLAHAGIMFNAVVFCLLYPIVYGFAAMTLVTFAVGGPEVLLILWKGVLYFGFLAYCFLGSHYRIGLRLAEASRRREGKVACGTRCGSSRSDFEFRERAYFPAETASLVWPMRRRVWFANWDGWSRRWY